VRVEGEADGWDLPVSVSQRGEKGEPDERDPPVSDRLKEEARAAPAWAERGQAGLRAEFLDRSRQCCFSFSVYAKFDVCLNLNRKSYVDSKIMKLFV
jgi:hypothetical protein